MIVDEEEGNPDHQYSVRDILKLRRQMEERLEQRARQGNCPRDHRQRSA